MYEQPVVLTNESGFTYSLDTQSAYILNDSIGMAMQSAQVPGADIVLDSTIGYNQAARASHSATSFKSAMATKFENMIQSHEKRQDIDYLYGQDNLGLAPLQAVTVSSSVTFTVSTASWATGFWIGSEGSNIVFAYSADNTAVDSLRAFAISAVDTDARTITVIPGTQGTPGTLTTLETAIEANELAIYWYGTVSGTGVSFAYATCAGLKKIITNTGTLFNVSAASYNLWRGNAYTTTGQLTMGKVLAAVSKPVQKGLESEVDFYCNPSTWSDLATNLAALRRFDGSYSKKRGEIGNEVLQYYNQNGLINIFSYNLLKEGDAIAVPRDSVIRLGARKIGLTDPTRQQDDIFFTIPGRAGVGVRSYGNSAIFCEKPAQTVYISGIVNSLAA